MSQFIVRLLKRTIHEYEEAFLTVKVPDDTTKGELGAKDLAQFVSHWDDPESEPEEVLDMQTIEETDDHAPDVSFVRDESGKLVLLTQ